jgi:hypothetical protein
MAEETFMFAVTAGIFVFLGVMLSFIRARRYSQANEDQSSSRILAGDLRLWIYLPIGLIIVLGIILWFPYEEHQRQTNTAAEPKVVTIWGYIESETFRILLVSLGIPIFIFLFESKFKTFESYASSIKERVIERIKERREKRLQIIDHTTKMWQTLFGLADELVIFDYEDNNSKAKLNELLIKIKRFPPEADEVISELMHGFSNVLDPDKDIQIVVDLVNVLFHPTITVGNYIQDCLNANKKADIPALQSSLNVIKQYVREVYYHSFIEMIKQASLKLTLIENKMLEKETNLSEVENQIEVVMNQYISENERNEIKRIEEEEINRRRSRIQIHLKETNEEKGKYTVDIINADEKDNKDQFGSYQLALKNLKARIKRDRTKYIQDLSGTDELEKFRNAYESLPLEVRMKSLRYGFTKDGIMKFTAWCDNRTKVISVISETQEEMQKQEQAEIAQKKP